jgi:uncharacterized protein YbjT (DUF2867 family)
VILVTSATGNNGIELLKLLSNSCATVRAMIRKPRGRATDGLPGVEFVTGDFDDPATIRQALDGVKCTFLVTNSSQRAEEQQLGFVNVARSAGLRQIVYLSQLHAAVLSPVRFFSRYPADVETSRMTYTNLHPNLYMDPSKIMRTTGAEKCR